MSLTVPKPTNRLFNVASNIADASLPTPAVGGKIENSSAPSPAGMTTKVVMGSLWTLAGQVAPLGFSMVATPFVIRLLGSEGYGALVLIALIPTYFTFADFGMGMASTKFGSEAYAEGDKEKEARTVRTAAVIALLASLPFALAIFLFSYNIIRLFNVPEHLLNEASAALKIASITFVINFLNNIFNTPQLARLRMDLNTIVTVVPRILGIIATPIVIYLGGGIFGAVLVLLMSSLLTFAGHLFVSGGLLPELFGLAIDRNAVRHLVRFGGALIGSGVAALLLANLEKGILPRLVSISALAHYSVAFTIALMLTMFSNSMTQSLIPAFSQLQGPDNRSQLQSLFSRAVRMTLIWLIPTLVLLSILAKPFFTLWAGEEYGRESVPIFYILVSGLILNIPAYVPYAAIMASGRTKIFLKLYFLELIPYIFILVFLTKQFGTMGAAIAWSFRATVDALIMFFITRRELNIAYSDSQFSHFMLSALIMLVPFVATFYFADSYLILGALFMTSFSLYVCMIWRIVLQDEEKIWLRARAANYGVRFGN